MRFALVVAALFACQPEKECPPAPDKGAIETEGKEVVLLVNGEHAITGEMLDTVTARLSASQLDRMKESGQIDQFYEQVAVGEVLYERAREQGLFEELDVGMAMAVRQYVAGIMVQRASEAGVTDEALQAKYEERAVQYKRPQVKAHHILVKEESLAKELLEKINGGADFATLAREHSIDPGSGRKGGDLGWFEKERMVEPFSNAAFAANKGDVVGPVESRFGFHVIRVDDKRDATPLEEVRESLAAQIKREAQEKFLKELKDELSVERKGRLSGTEVPAGGDGSGPGGRDGKGKASGGGGGGGGGGGQPK